MNNFFHLHQMLYFLQVLFAMWVGCKDTSGIERVRTPAKIERDFVSICLQYRL